MTGFGAAESGVDRRDLRYFVVTLVFIASWLAIAVSDFGSARIAGAVASTSEPAVFSRAKAGHQSSEGCHGFRSFLTEVACKPFVPDTMSESRKGFRVRTVDDLVLFD